MSQSDKEIPSEIYLAYQINFKVDSLNKNDDFIRPLHVKNKLFLSKANYFLIQ